MKKSLVALTIAAAALVPTACSTQETADQQHSPSQSEPRSPQEKDAAEVAAGSVIGAQVGAQIGQGLPDKRHKDDGER